MPSMTMAALPTASFFPTPLEIAGGLRWVREHPVVATAAAAAATAVSVLTYLKARAEDQHFDTDDDEDEDAVHDGRRTAAASCDCGKDESCSSTDSDASSPSRGRHVSVSGGHCNTVNLVVTLYQHVYMVICMMQFEDEGAEVRREDEGEARADLLSSLEAVEQNGSASPHWGWYVSTTPPEDYYDQ